MLPSIKQIGAAIEGLFVMEDWHNFSAYYDKTLMAWYANVQKNWHQLSHRYNDYFKRMWDYYLLSCAAVFRSRHGQLWQVVLSKNGMPGGYNSVR
jgi:cyclopropane-fatty-acyl-phospholipid synthase